MDVVIVIDPSINTTGTALRMFLRLNDKILASKPEYRNTERVLQKSLL